MKNFAKKFLCITMVVALVLACVACSGKQSEEDALKKFIQSQGNAFIDSFEQAFEENAGGLGCECTLDSNGTKLIVNCKILGLDNIPDETKQEMQKLYDEQKEALKTNFEAIKIEVPSLSAVEMNITEQDDDLIAKIDLEF